MFIYVFYMGVWFFFELFMVFGENDDYVIVCLVLLGCGIRMIGYVVCGFLGVLFFIVYENVFRNFKNCVFKFFN